MGLDQKVAAHLLTGARYVLFSAGGCLNLEPALLKFKPTPARTEKSVQLYVRLEIRSTYNLKLACARRAGLRGWGRLTVQAGSIVKRKSDDALFRNEEVVVMKYSLGLLRATSLRSVYV